MVPQWSSGQRIGLLEVGEVELSQPVDNWKERPQEDQEYGAIYFQNI